MRRIGSFISVCLLLGVVSAGEPRADTKAEVRPAELIGQAVELLREKHTPGNLEKACKFVSMAVASLRKVEGAYYYECLGRVSFEKSKLKISWPPDHSKRPPMGKGPGVYDQGLRMDYAFDCTQKDRPARCGENGAPALVQREVLIDLLGWEEKEPLGSVAENLKLYRNEGWSKEFIELVEESIAWGKKINQASANEVYKIATNYSRSVEFESGRRMLFYIAARKGSRKARNERRYKNSTKRSPIDHITMKSLARDGYLPAQIKFAAYMGDRAYELDNTAQAVFWMLVAKSNGGDISEILDQISAAVTPHTPNLIRSWILGESKK